MVTFFTIKILIKDFLSYWSSFTSTLLQLFSMNFRTDSRADSDIEGLKRKLTNKLYVQCDGFVPDWKLGKMARLQQTQRKRVGIVPRLPVDVVAAIAAEVTRLIPSLLSPSVAQVPQKTHLIGITFIQFK
ncbi:uncharacterized protein LOC141687104 isoform X2 [Apium graveolens]|uniref:uncharacterized protein LOC141687104 isoform X2 n=1 Tax=Apium graveolens TaxID=4045 RepID=UPI003D7A167B